MSYFSISLSNGHGTMVHGSDVPQTSLVHITLQSPEGGALAELQTSIHSFIKALFRSGHEQGTLSHYVDHDGKIRTEKPPDYVSISDRLSEAMAEVDRDQSRLCAEATDFIQKMEEGHVKPNKANLAKLRQAVATIASHSQSNRGYAASKMREVVQDAEVGAFMGIVGILTQAGVNTGEEVEGRVAAMLGLSGSPLRGQLECDAHAPDAPVPIGKCDLPKVDVPIAKMTNADLAREIAAELHKWEHSRDNKVHEGHDTKELYCANAIPAKNGVRICYISYQGSNTIDTEGARRYLEALRSGRRERHFQFASGSKR